MNVCTMLFSCCMLLYELTHCRLGIGLQSAKPLARNKLQLIYTIVYCNFVSLQFYKYMSVHVSLLL